MDMEVVTNHSCDRKETNIKKTGTTGYSVGGTTVPTAVVKDFVTVPTALPVGVGARGDSSTSK